MEIISLISGYLQYELLIAAADGIEISMDEANANDIREQIVAIIYLITFLISAITFLLWFKRAYENLHLKANNLLHSVNWATGSWFVPIIHLYRPYQIMKELYEKTKDILVKNGLILETTISTKFLGWWWAFWIISSIYGQFLYRFTMNANTIDQLTTSTIAGMIGNLIGIPLAIITIKIIKDYSNIERLLFNIKYQQGLVCNELNKFTKCPNCQVEIELEEQELKEKKYVCPECKKNIDLN